MSDNDTIDLDDIDEEAPTGEFEPLPDDDGGEDDEAPLQMPSLLDDPDDTEDGDEDE